MGQRFQEFCLGLKPEFGTKFSIVVTLVASFKLDWMISALRQKSSDLAERPEFPMSNEVRPGNRWDTV